VTLDQFVVMPNHVHGILLLTALDTEPSPGCRRPPVSEVVRAFKSYSGRRINRQRGTVGLPVWQRNYYERVLRDEGELMAARIYILENPLRWGSDPQR
jgi:REP element-mobilizing transposase RayT